MCHCANELYKFVIHTIQNFNSWSLCQHSHFYLLPFVYIGNSDSQGHNFNFSNISSAIAKTIIYRFSLQMVLNNKCIILTL